MAPKAAAGKAGAKADPKAKAKGEKKVKKEPKEDDTPKVPEPDQKAHQEALDKVQAKIDELQKEAQAITAKISERSAGKDDFFKAKAEIRAELDEVQEKMNAVKAEKDGVKSGIDSKKAEDAEAKSALNKMKGQMNYTSEAEIDDRIATIEFKMWTDSLSLKQEKEYLKEIAELKKTKPRLAELSKLQNKVEGLKGASGGDLREKNRSLAEMMQTLYQQKLAIQERLKELTEKRKNEVGDVSGDMEKREAVQKKIQALVQERSELRDAFKAQMTEFKAHLAEQRRIRNEKYQEERKAQEAEWKMKKMQGEIEKLDVNPQVSVMVLIEQTITFCKSLLPQEKTEEKEEKKETVFNNKDGETVLLRKDAREEEFFFAPTAKKRGKKGKASSGDDGSKKAIKHNAETFKLFDALKVEAPITVADVPAVLEKLEKEMVVCQEKLDAWEAQKEEMKQKILDGSATYNQLIKGDVEETEEDKEEEKEDTSLDPSKLNSGELRKRVLDLGVLSVDEVDQALNEWEDLPKEYQDGQSFLDCCRCVIEASASGAPPGNTVQASASNAPRWGTRQSRPIARTKVWSWLGGRRR